MAKKEFFYRGKSVPELQKMSLTEFSQFATARTRRTIKRGLGDERQKVLTATLKNQANIETHKRDMLVVPAMIGRIIKIHNGKEFIPITISEEMIGHYLGEFAMTRKHLVHSSPGIGASRSSSSLSVK